jgi:riboflavin synthase
VADGVAVGDSVAVDGACLTVAELAPPRATFDLSGETLQRTTLGELRVNDRVNLERALRVGDRLGGHFVQGHVDAVGVISRKETQPGQWTVDISLPTQVAALLVPKGSVAVDGISLTVADLGPDRFTVALIPHTVQATTIQFKAVGDRVNIETDLIGKYVARLVGRGHPGAVTADLLARHGFMT